MSEIVSITDMQIPMQYDSSSRFDGSKNAIRLKEIYSRQTQDSDHDNQDCPDLDFMYSDSDLLMNEISELYSYSEQPEFQLNEKAFEEYMEFLKLRPCWRLLTLEEKNNVIITLLDQLDVIDRIVRQQSTRCILYLLQGCWAECQSDVEQQINAKNNVILLYKHGVFTSFMELFFAEAETCSIAIQRKVSVNINDSTELRIILSGLYTIVETIRNIGDDDCKQNINIRNELLYEICNPIGDELLSVKLFGMVTRFCGGGAPHFPIKKILLLIWKLLLFSLGGYEELKNKKMQKRQEAGLPIFDEHTLDIIKTMRASSPPVGGIDGNDNPNPKRSTRQLRRSLIKQSSLDETLNMEYDGPLDEDDFDEQTKDNGGPREIDVESRNELSDISGSAEINNDKDNDFNEIEFNLNETTTENNKNVEDEINNYAPNILGTSFYSGKGLPWMPKIRQKDLDAFFDQIRLKFVGYTLPDDRDTLMGLPLPVHEGVRILKSYIYVSLSDLQMEKEVKMSKYPISQKETIVDENPTEILYQAMLPQMQQIIIALLKILLASAPYSKTKTDSINIIADVLPEEMPTTVSQSMKLSTDVNRHKEIIVKAVSAILLLLLKHFKLNHIYQFEFLSQYLVFANCIPLILKFFNQNIISYVNAKHAIPILDFPSCVIGDQPELTPECLGIGDNQVCCWRNVFACINLLRVLNKVTKWKHSRIMMLVVFKSAPILKRTLKVRHAMMQLYILKLLKMQTKYLGRVWRKGNMKIISAIYQKVRHRLNDDWAYGNDIDARPWDYQAEECALRSSVDEFNNRRYFSHTGDVDMTPVDVNLSSVLATNIELVEEFRKHYQVWLQQEVFNDNTNWDELLSYGYL